MARFYCSPALPGWWIVHSQGHARFPIGAGGAHTCDRSRLARIAGRPDSGGQLLLARPAVGGDVNACPGRPSPGNSFFGHGHRVYLDPLWGRPGEMILPYLIARKGQVLISSQFGNESTRLFAGCPASPGRKAGRGVPPGRGIYPQRRGFADRGFGPGFREVNLSITDVIIFLGLVAFGSTIQRPGLAVACK